VLFSTLCCYTIDFIDLIMYCINILYSVPEGVRCSILRNIWICCSQDGECGPLAETSIDVSGGLETHGHMCLLPFNAVSGMAYAIKFRKGESFGGSSAVVRATAVLCGEIQYKIDQGGINEITMGEDSYEVDYPDPLKDFNTRALAILDISSVKASCMKVFHAFQREILGKSHVKDVLDKEECTSLESHTCGLYRNTVGRRAATPPLVE
ncbi:hypothetical protein FOZ62_014727, partial [Perkinsus olseni]